MQKWDFKTYQKHFQNCEILPKFSETHVFRGTILHPLYCKKFHVVLNMSSSHYSHPTVFQNWTKKNSCILQRKFLLHVFLVSYPVLKSSFLQFHETNFL